jgi:hypothetical protein
VRRDLGDADGAGALCHADAQPDADPNADPHADADAHPHPARTNQHAHAKRAADAHADLYARTGNPDRHARDAHPDPHLDADLVGLSEPGGNRDADLDPDLDPNHGVHTYSNRVCDRHVNADGDGDSDRDACRDPNWYGDPGSYPDTGATCCAAHLHLDAHG